MVDRSLQDQVTDKRNEILKWIDTAIEEAFKRDGTFTLNREFYLPYLDFEIGNLLELLDKVEGSGKKNSKWRPRF